MAGSDRVLVYLPRRSEVDIEAAELSSTNEKKGGTVWTCEK